MLYDYLNVFGFVRVDMQTLFFYSPPFPDENSSLLRWKNLLDAKEEMEKKGWVLRFDESFFMWKSLVRLR